ncbi:hypothetical protein CPBF367_29950 [Xanthomonas arboricola pv. juglandis]|nr:hypothetical protein CPBF367_29950 [Xanthomonas arboricola pv. juglandis]
MMPGSDRGPIVMHGFHDDGDGFTGLSRIDRSGLRNAPALKPAHARSDEGRVASPRATLMADECLDILDQAAAIVRLA